MTYQARMTQDFADSFFTYNVIARPFIREICVIRA